MEEFHVGDLHLGHNNIIRFRDSKDFPLRYRVEDMEIGIFPPFETVQDHDDYLVDRWNKVVRKGDKVWVHGDVAFKREALLRVRELNGDKRLIMGNHDTFTTEAYLEAGFSKVYGAVERHGVILTHIPVHPSQLSRYRANVHGHLHDEKVRRPVYESPGPIDARYVNVSVEQTRFQPVSWDELKLHNPILREEHAG